MKWRACQLCASARSGSANDYDIDSTSECRRIKWGEFLVILVRGTNGIDRAPEVVHGSTKQRRTTAADALGRPLIPEDSLKIPHVFLYSSPGGATSPSVFLTPIFSFVFVSWPIEQSSQSRGTVLQGGDIGSEV